MDRKNDYSLATAWRGVASPAYLRLERWLSFVEDLGGVRGLDPGPQGPLSTFLPGLPGAAGKVDMSLMTVTAKTQNVEELRRFVTEQLQRHERLVLMLFYAERLSIEEIAETLDLPEATVANCLNKTLATLREQFG
jgi:hypothetical protein